MKVASFRDLGADLRGEMRGLRWLLLKAEDLSSATDAWMFAELDGVFIAIDHRGSKFESGIHNRAIHLLLLDEMESHVGITKIVCSGELEDYLW